MNAKVNKLEENSNIQEMYKDINEFKMGYEHCAYVINKDDDAIVADITSILTYSLPAVE